MEGTIRDMGVNTNESQGMFSVKVNYSIILNRLSPSFLPSDKAMVLSKVWASWAPLKVTLFSWQALLTRIPTKFNLLATAQGSDPLG
ncbi:hypothetical protein A2U01_0041597, partial [Trifolium medium]|nr:hypothetical protein [Trifolium medium]